MSCEPPTRDFGGEVQMNLTAVFGMKHKLILYLSVLLISKCIQVDDKNDVSGTKNTNYPTNTPVGDQSQAIPDIIDKTSHGGTITFQNIGTIGWYPSRRDPATGPCDIKSESDCCQAKHNLTTDSLTPWNEELIVSLRGPMVVKQVAVYQPHDGTAVQWDRTSYWDDKAPSIMDGIAFKGNNTEKNGFQGTIGNTCLIDVSTNNVFKTGAGSVPYCPQTNDTKYYGWEGSKMIVVQASMPRVSSGIIDTTKHCGVDQSNNWYDAPWIGFSHGEMVRSGAYGSCHCYAKDATKWYLADGCGQFNAFEVVNDNNEYQNFDLFSTNFFGYGGYVGEGPCGKNCKVSALSPEIDLVNKATSTEAITGAIASPTKGPGVAFRRPITGYRYFIVLFDIRTRTVQMALIHPGSIPSSVQVLLPGLPKQLSRAVIDDILALRLPKTSSTGVLR
jgi:hypothetical protein